MRKRSAVAALPSPEESATAIVSSEPQAYVNAVWQGSKVVLLWRDERGELRKREVPAEFACHLRLSDWTPELERECRSSRAIKGFSVEGEWVRLRFVDRDCCRELCGPRGYFEDECSCVWKTDLARLSEFIRKVEQVCQVGEVYQLAAVFKVELGTFATINVSVFQEELPIDGMFNVAKSATSGFETLRGSVPPPVQEIIFH